MRQFPAKCPFTQNSVQAPLAYAVVLVLFFDIKSRREEVWLMQHFSEYAEYRRHAKKLIPFIY